MTTQLDMFVQPGPIEFPVGAKFGGKTYEPKHDRVRLTGQWLVVFNLMADQCWRTLEEISELTGYPTQSVSGRMRHFRKIDFGGHTVDRRRVGDPKRGIHEYQLVVRESGFY